LISTHLSLGVRLLYQPSVQIFSRTGSNCSNVATLYMYICTYDQKYAYLKNYRLIIIVQFAYALVSDMLHRKYVHIS
jgi:hypothetical protein